MLRLCHRITLKKSKKNYDKQSVLIPPLKEIPGNITAASEIEKKLICDSTVRKMKKLSTLLLITFSIATQALNAQLDLAFISNFSVSATNSCNRLTWVIASNPAVKSFEIERSTDGKDFKTIAVLLATEKFGTENYTYADTAIGADTIMYRLRILNKSLHDFYSRIIVVRSKLTADNGVRIMGNPVKDKLFFNYGSTKAQQADIKIYSLTGKILFNQEVNTFKGNNLITIPLSSGFAPGMYVLEINNDIVSQTAKFVKQ